jgi:nicotinate-nucleotide adenylyltransferase
MPQETRKIGLMGGGFDPIHWGHLGAAIESAYQVGLEKVLLSATGQPPHKEPVASAEHRFEMTRLAALESPFSRGGVLEATRLELDAPGPHFTVETLRRLRDLEPEAELHLIVGTDAARTLEQWRAIDDILVLARIIVVERVGFTEKPAPNMKNPGPDFIKSAPEGDYNSNHRSASPTTVVSWPGVAISSSEIRRRVGIKAPIEYLVPRSVADYLKRFDLYR